LTAIGIVVGQQWIDGSFVENVETNRGRPPADVDIVTLAYRPAAVKDQAGWVSLVNSHIQLFDNLKTKSQYMCDAYFIDLNKAPHLITYDVAYFNGLFSHQRVTFQWKGMIAIDLASDDAAARQLL
jgi:hypothetical protein